MIFLYLVNCKHILMQVESNIVKKQFATFVIMHIRSLYIIVLVKGKV